MVGLLHMPRACALHLERLTNFHAVVTDVCACHYEDVFTNYTHCNAAVINVFP